MRKGIKRFIVTALMAALLTFSATADEWDGSTVGKLFYLNGNVGVGTAAPKGKLDVNGTIYSTAGGDLLRIGALQNQSFLRVDSQRFYIAPFGANTGHANSENMVAIGCGPNDGKTVKFLTVSDAYLAAGSGNVGIGTVYPESKLHISGTSGYGAIIKTTNIDTGKTWHFGTTNSNFFTIAQTGVADWLAIKQDSGNIGLGTVNPLAKLHVNGEILAAGTDLLRVGTAKTDVVLRNYEDYLFIAPFGVGNLNQNRVRVGGALDEGGQTVEFATVSNTFLATNNGGVGIGTENIGGHKLAVNGSIRAKEVRINTDWADFVFEDDYELQSLDEVENFIEDNGHLPGIPSAEEVERDGISLGEIDAKLLQKIEELTLYMIEMKKENEMLKNKVEALEAK